MTTDLVKLSDALQKIEFNGDEIAFIKDKYCPNATEMEFKEFVAICQMIGANPFLKEIYFIKYGKGENATANIVFSYHYMIKKAEASGLFQGFTEAEYFDPDADKWVKVWTDLKRFPAACRIGVYRKDWPEPRYGQVLWRERFKDQSEWKKQPIHMITKCVMVHVLRLYFSEIAAGMMIREEMVQTPPGQWTDGTEEDLKATREASQRVEDERVQRDGKRNLSKERMTTINKKFKRLSIKKEDGVSTINEILKTADMPTVSAMNELNNNTADLVIHALENLIQDREELRLKLEGEERSDTEG